MLAQRVVPWALLLALGAGALLTACGPVGPTAQQCPRHQYGLPASTPTSLIAVIPRDSGASAQWGLRELASLLPLVAQPGLQLHVLYTQDADDLAPAGGDGGPPQVLATSAPSVLAFRVPRRRRAGRPHLAQCQAVLPAPGGLAGAGHGGSAGGGASGGPSRQWPGRGRPQRALRHWPVGRYRTPPVLRRGGRLTPARPPSRRP